MTENDYKLLCALRANAAKKVSQLQRETGLSAPAIYAKMKQYEETGLIKRTTILPDFKKLGYMHIIFMIENGSEEFFLKNQNVNTAFALDDKKIVAECYFTSGAQLDKFVNALEEQYPSKITFWIVAKELKKEMFFTDEYC
jgi:DNA-binding Lrp family transcriptional regulator